MAETAGSLIDKICISELKIFHMQEQVDRTDVTADHRERCQEKIRVLNIQRDDLSTELNTLLERWAQGDWIPKIYRQFKMYNDPQFRIPTPSSETTRVR